MGLVLKSNNYNIKIDSNKIIGVMGKDYDRFLVSIKGRDISYIGKLDSFYTNSVYDEISLYENDNNIIEMYLDKLLLNKDFLSKKISDLSSGEKHLLRYLIGFIQNKNIIIIDEPFMDLDYNYKKRIIYLLNDMINNKTVIIGSFSSDIIYNIASKVLLINDNSYFYGDIKSVFSDLDILSLYNIKMPEIVKFVALARNNKGIMIDYSNDVRDLIKDVYRNV